MTGVFNNMPLFFKIPAYSQREQLTHLDTITYSEAEIINILQICYDYDENY